MPNNFAAINVRNIFALAKIAGIYGREMFFYIQYIGSKLRFCAI